MRAATDIELQLALDEFMSMHNVPGAAVAILDGDQVIQAATGVINKSTGVAATADTLFQIGSISKIYTTTLVMQLLDDGSVDLDASVATYLPGIKLPDPDVAESITVRQLLCHTSGLEGDYEDTGRGDDCVKKFVDACSTSLAQISPPGTMFSYCNGAFVIAGRLIEQVTGQTWDAVLKERLLDPLRTQRTCTLPEEAILYRAAVGHVDPTNSGELRPAQRWVLPRSGGPAGRILSTAAEVLSFVRMHLDGGIAADGTPVLSRTSVRAMQEEQVELVDRWFSGLAWGLGWILFDWDGHKVIGHDGGTIGQAAFLRIVPESRFAICLLTNGSTGVNLYRDLFKRVFAERLSIDLPELPDAADSLAFDPSPYVGTYVRKNQRTQIQLEDGGLVASIEWGDLVKGIVAPVEKQPLRPIDSKNFLIRLPSYEADMPLVFFDFDDSGRPRYFHSGGRANPRVA